MPLIPIPDFLSPIVENDIPTDEFQRWLTQITLNDLLVGKGSPEGVVEARIGRKYLDTVGASGSTQYIKQLADISGDRKKGWVL